MQSKATAMELKVYFLVVKLLLAVLSCQSRLQEEQEDQAFKFERQYILDKTFAKGFHFEDVTDIAVNSEMGHVLVLQRSTPPLTIWDINGTLVSSWNTTRLGYPHSLSLNGSDPHTANIWVTDMAGTLSAGTMYGHCVKNFSYFGEYHGSIGSCGAQKNGSGVDPIQFDRVTDMAWSSSGRMFVADGDLGGLNNRVAVLSPSLKLVGMWNSGNRPGSGPVEFNLPHTIAVDRCDRVWITDALNHRVQVMDEYGTFLGEMSCFEDTLIYGIDFIPLTSGEEGIILSTRNAVSNQAGLVVVPIKMDCSAMKEIGDCKPLRRFALRDGLPPSSSMLHSVTVHRKTGDLYLSLLPGKSPPLKYIPAASPPVPAQHRENCTSHPPRWPWQWNATVLLTPYTSSSLMMAHLMYSALNKAMLVRLQGPLHEEALNLEVLTIGEDSYIIDRDAQSNIHNCSGPYDKGWTTPAPDWLSRRNCKCHGALNSAGVDTTLWQCSDYRFADWFWFETSKNLPWRMFFNNNTNPFGIPVLGSYTMVSFASYGADTTRLKEAVHICTSTKGHVITDQTVGQAAPSIWGFSYAGCQGERSLRKWPSLFYMTTTMLPVSKTDPLPTQVLYDWAQHSQNTLMLSADSTTTAYLIRNSTYIKNQSHLGGSSCSRLDFGPPSPQWMFEDNCKCMGTITNSMLSPWPQTVVAVCPLQNGRVFWTWFGTRLDEYNPVVFFETLSPYHEGTNLAFADYHAFYSGDVLVDMMQFEVPKECPV